MLKEFRQRRQIVSDPPYIVIETDAIVAIEPAARDGKALSIVHLKGHKEFVLDIPYEQLIKELDVKCLAITKLK